MNRWGADTTEGPIYIKSGIEGKEWGNVVEEKEGDVGREEEEMSQDLPENNVEERNIEE